jgi:hypothetical protein
MKKIIQIVIIGIIVLSGLGASTLPILKNMTTGSPSHNYNIRTLYGTSTDWAGYVVVTNLNSPKKYSITDVKGSWIVPTVTDSVTPNTYSSCWIGIDGYSSKTVEQIGTDSNVINGKAEYLAWYEMYPKPPVYLDMKINAGDTISAEVNFLGNGMFQLSIKDVTTGESFSIIKKSRYSDIKIYSNPMIEVITEHVFAGKTRPLLSIMKLIQIIQKTITCDNCNNVRHAAISYMITPIDEEILFAAPHRSSAEWIVEAPSDLSGVLPLGDFGTAYFFDSQVTINGVTGSINDAQWQNDAITMQTSTSPPIIKAQPSLLSTDGTNFSVTWHHH